MTSLANLSESLNNGDTSDIQPEDQSASEITRYEPGTYTAAVRIKDCEVDMSTVTLLFIPHDRRGNSVYGGLGWLLTLSSDI